MTDKPIDWTPDLTLPTSKSTAQHFTANSGDDRLEIDTTPLETIAEDFKARKAAGNDRRLAQTIEDDEVRETLGLRRVL